MISFDSLVQVGDRILELLNFDLSDGLLDELAGLLLCRGFSIGSGLLGSSSGGVGFGGFRASATGQSNGKAQNQKHSSRKERGHPCRSGILAS